MNEKALVEVAMTFGQHCESKLTPDAVDAFLQAFRKHIEKGLEKVTWGDHQRRVLGWAAEIGKEAYCRSENGTVNADQFRAACAAKIPGWQEECKVGEAYGPFCAAGTI